MLVIPVLLLSVTTVTEIDTPLMSVADWICTVITVPLIVAGLPGLETNPTKICPHSQSAEDTAQ